MRLRNLSILAALIAAGCGFGGQFTAAELKAKFRQLSLGMTDREVEKRLGKPTNSTQGKAALVWSYYGQKGAMLSIRLKNGKVIGAFVSNGEDLEVLNALNESRRAAPTSSTP